MGGFGLTILLRCYTNAQYTLVSTSLKDVGFKILGIVLLYFNLGVEDYIKPKQHDAARHTAGWAGMVFVTLSVFDGMVRPKHKKVRVFDELAIVALFAAIWALFYAMFENISLIFMGLTAFSTFFTLGNLLLDGCPDGATGPVPHEAIAAVLTPLRVSQKITKLYLLQRSY